MLGFSPKYQFSENIWGIWKSGFPVCDWGSMTTNLNLLNLRLGAAGRLAGFFNTSFQVAEGCAVPSLSKLGCAVRSFGESVCCREETGPKNGFGGFAFSSCLQLSNDGRGATRPGGLIQVRR